MKTSFALCLLLLVLSACEWGEMPKKEKHPIFTDTLVYTYKTINEHATDCAGKPDSTCTSVKIAYPLFKGQALLNDTIKSKLLKLFAASHRPDTGFNQMAINFIKSYTKFKNDEPGSKLYFTLKSEAKIIHQDSALLTVQFSGYNFTGGAHGASFTRFVNWNPKAGKEIMLNDICIKGYQSRLTTIAEGIFRKQEKLTPTASLKPDYFFNNAKFALKENYAITPIGLRFIYNEYEIKPYAAGQTELFIPYTAIRSLLRPGSVVVQFLNKNAGI